MRGVARFCVQARVALACAALVCAGACARDGRADAASHRPLPPRRAGIPLDLSYVDRGSPAYARFKRWVDLAVMGAPDDGFTAYDAALLYRLDPQPAYCSLAIRMTDDEVSAAEAAIAAGDAPTIAGYSYLDVGPRIAALSLTLDSCRARIDETMRARWSAYAGQAVWNVWHPWRAHWGAWPHPWTGWATDNPGNNYHYSFLEATLYWALPRATPAGCGCSTKRNCRRWLRLSPRCRAAAAAKAPATAPRTCACWRSRGCGATPPVRMSRRRWPATTSCTGRMRLCRHSTGSRRSATSPGSRCPSCTTTTVASCWKRARWPGIRPPSRWRPGGCTPSPSTASRA